MVLILAACTSDDPTPTPTATTTATATATPPAPLTLLETYREALNSGDVRTFVSLYADDVTFTLGAFDPAGTEFNTLTGLAEVLAGDLGAIENNAHFTFSNTSVDGNTAKGEFLSTDDELEQFGIGSTTGTIEVVVEDGLTTSITATADEETRAKFAALFGPPPGPPPQANEVTFTAVDTADGHAFQGPDSLPAGWTPIRFENDSSEEWHHMILIKLPEDLTAQGLIDALLAGGPETPPPPGLEFPGGPSVILPGGSASTTVNLEQGDHVLICFVSNDDGVPHFVSGLWKALTVTAATGPLAPEPAADVTIDMFDEPDFGFDISAPITAGTHTIRVTNSGPQLHEVTVIQLAPGASAAFFLAALEADAGGPPPGKPLGGLTTIESGGYAFFTAVFAPGNYALICFEEDEETGAPHTALGMVVEFTVQ